MVTFLTEFYNTLSLYFIKKLELIVAPPKAHHASLAYFLRGKRAGGPVRHFLALGTMIYLFLTLPLLTPYSNLPCQNMIYD